MQSRRRPTSKNKDCTVCDLIILFPRWSTSHSWMACYKRGAGLQRDYLRIEAGDDTIMNWCDTCIDFFLDLCVCKNNPKKELKKNGCLVDPSPTGYDAIDLRGEKTMGSKSDFLLPFNSYNGVCVYAWDRTLWSSSSRLLSSFHHLWSLRIGLKCNAFVNPWPGRMSVRKRRSSPA